MHVLEFVRVDYIAECEKGKMDSITDAILQAHVVLDALPHVRAVRQSRCNHEHSLRVLAVAFSLSYALRAQAAQDVEQVRDGLQQCM